MSRSSWLLFMLVGLVPPLLLSRNVVSGSIALVALFPALAAMLVLSSDEAPRPVPGHGTKRLLVAVGVVVVVAAARLALTGLDGLLYKALAVGVPAVVAAWVLSGVYAPSPAVRRWVRSLVATGAPRATFLVAILAWPLVAAVAIAICATLPDLSVAPPRAATAGAIAATAVTGVFTAALAALGWYGFAARRLLLRLSPLETGLLLGVVQWLVVWGFTLRPDTVLEPFFLFRLAGFAAAGVAGVWVYGRSHGSLLPVWLLGLTLVVAQEWMYLTVTPDVVARTDTLPGLFAAGQVLVAAALVASGRMWWRPAATDTATPEPRASV